MTRSWGFCSANQKDGEGKKGVNLLVELYPLATADALLCFSIHFHLIDGERKRDENVGILKRFEFELASVFAVFLLGIFAFLSFCVPSFLDQKKVSSIPLAV